MPTLVVGVDFSKASRKALDAAVALAKKLDASLVVVHATSPLPLGSVRGHLDAVTQVTAEVEAAEAAQLAATWVKKAGKVVPVAFITKTGSPAGLVLRVAKAKRALYIVVGSHGRSGIKRAVLGSVAERIIRKSTIPVLVVPA